MNSFYAQMLTAMQARITEAVPEIRYMDIDLGQLEHYEGDRPPVSFPCVLVEFNSTKFAQLGQLVEEGDCSITCRLGFAPYSATNSLAPDEVKEKGLNYFEIENSLYAALKGWAPGEGEELLCQPLNRLSDGTEGRNDKLRVRVLTFTTSYMDDTATNAPVKATPGLQIERLE